MWKHGVVAFISMSRLEIEEEQRHYRRAIQYFVTTAAQYNLFPFVFRATGVLVSISVPSRPWGRCTEEGFVTW